MKTIEATVLVPADRQLTLRLPEDVSPGEHHIVLLIDELPQPEDGEATPTRWEGGLLVYGGEVMAPAQAAIDEFREERLGHFFRKAP